MDDPVAFVRARIDEAEVADLNRGHDSVLRNIEAWRLLLAGHEGVHRCDWGEHRGGDFGPCRQVRVLALTWSGHPDYDPDWAP